MIVERQPKPLLKDIAYDKIKELILTEKVEPNQMLSERELIDILEMSKTPIKSALIRLESEGFVKVSSKQGIIVLDISLERILNIYDLRVALESFVCAKLHMKVTDSGIALLQEAVDEMDQAANRKDVHHFTKWDHEFHLTMARLTENYEIERVLLNYNDHLKRITFKHLKKDVERMAQFNEEHKTILASLSDPNAEPARLIEEHLIRSKQKLLN